MSVTVVVTGAAGFLGAHLVRALAARGHRVAGIDRRPGVPPEAAVTLTAELSGPATVVDDLLREADGVVHLAGRPGVRDTGADAELARRRDNVEAGRRVLETVPLAAPLVVVSSSAVYGGSRGAPCAETDRLRPLGGYARSKVALERLTARRVSRGGLVAVARPFTVAGEGQRPDMAIARWLRAVRHELPLVLLGGPDRTRDVTDVRDVTEGLLRMLERGVRATINLGTGQGHRLGDLAAAVCEAVGHDPGRVVLPAGGAEPGDTLADTTRCARLLGFVPRTDVRGLVRRQAAASAAPARTAAAGAPLPDAAPSR